MKLTLYYWFNKYNGFTSFIFQRGFKYDLVHRCIDLGDTIICDIMGVLGRDSQRVKMMQRMKNNVMDLTYLPSSSFLKEENIVFISRLYDTTSL